MKFSQFNSIVSIQDKYALYNSFHERVIFLEENLKEILKTAINNGVDTLLGIHPTFYAYLLEQEFIVDDLVNEIDKVKELCKIIDENHTSFFLTINPSMNCNFQCWYCYETHVKKSRLNEEIIGRIKQFIVHTANKDRMENFFLSFFGGEPLLYFSQDVIPIINCYAKECHSKRIPLNISFTTNGYLINQDFISYFKENNLTCSLQITLDGYKEKHDLVRFVSSNKGSYKEIIKNIHLLVMNKFFVRLRVNYTDKNIEDTYKIAEDLMDLPHELREKFLLFDYHRVWQNEQVDDTNIALKKNVEKIRQLGFKASGKYSPNNVRQSCYADKRNSVVINYNGDIFKCTARDFTNSNRAGFINENGELIWENEYLEQRMNAKFNNRPCLECRILPLCNGGCSQHALEHLGGSDYCVYFGNESEKDKVVKFKIEEILNKLST